MLFWCVLLPGWRGLAAENADRFKMPEEFQRQATKRIAEYSSRVRERVVTEDLALNAMIERIYAECVTGKLFDPMQPELPYRWFAPGGSYFLGQWLWDTMFVVNAFAPLDDDAVVREVFENYWYTIDHNPAAPRGSYRYGMVPNFMGARMLRKDDQAWPPVGYSQIPILAWGCLQAYRQTHDRGLLERALPYLVAFDEWYSTERDTDGDGLIEYGAYEAVDRNTLVQTARFETFDFHLPLDGMAMTQHPRRKEGGPWYGNVEGVEQTSFLLMSERAMVEIARELGQPDLAQRYEAAVDRRVEAMRQKMWDPHTEFFYSLDRDSDQRIPARTVQGFLTLAAGVPTAAQAAALAAQMKDPQRWWTPYPVPTCARDEARYDPRGYWRGDMWPPTTYLVAYGLRQYGYHDLARELTRRLGALIDERGISEHYDSQTGEPLGVPMLGMSCVIWSMIIENTYGIQEDFSTIRIPPGAGGRRLTLGKLHIAYPTDHSVTVRSEFDRDFHLVFPPAALSAPLRVTCQGTFVSAKFSPNEASFRADAGKTYQVERVNTPQNPKGDGPSSIQTQAELRVRVVDAATREPIPCTLRLVDANNRVVTESEGFRDGLRSSGLFTKVLPAGQTRMRITRGPEYRAVEKEIILSAGQINTVEVVLERQVDLRRRGWFAGDSHVHMIHGERTVGVNFDQVALAARAEDLQYLSLGHAWVMENPTPESLASELDRRSTPDCQLVWNIEAPKNYYLGDAGRCLGHCWNLGMRGRTAEGADVIELLLEASAGDYESSKPSFANFESHALIHAQGGKVFYTHPARWWMGEWGGEGGYPKQEKMRVSNMAVELPLDVLAGPTFDGLDVITGGGELAANEKSFQLWSLLLNHGYRLAATASSDACFDRPAGATPGAARLYTFLEGSFSIAAAAQATAQGRTFATTGPLLVVSVDGQPPGSAFPADGRARLLRLQAWSSGADTGGLARIEIFRNGQLWLQHKLDGRQTSFQTNQPISESQTAWYCVRLFGADEPHQRAISGAFFFDEKPWQPPSPAQAQVHILVLDADSGQALDATLTEVNYLGTQARSGTRHRLAGGAGTVVIPATARLRAEAAGFEPLTLSPFFDYPILVETITRLTDQDLLDWQTFERIRMLLGDVTLTFRLTKVRQDR